MKKILETLKQKWAEYLLEMIVIIVGILGAFALNSWNENLKEATQKKELVESLIVELTEKRKEVISDRSSLHRLVAKFDKIFADWHATGQLESENIPETIRLFQTDNVHFNANTHIYEGASASEIWKQIPDSIRIQIAALHNYHFGFLQNSYVKISDYSSFCKESYLVPNNLLDPNREIADIEKQIMLDPNLFFSHLYLIVSQLNRINTQSENAKVELDQVLKNLEAYKTALR